MPPRRLASARASPILPILLVSFFAAHLAVSGHTTRRARRQLPLPYCQWRDSWIPTVGGGRDRRRHLSRRRGRRWRGSRGAFVCHRYFDADLPLGSASSTAVFTPCRIRGRRCYCFLRYLSAGCRFGRCRLVVCCCRASSDLPRCSSPAPSPSPSSFNTNWAPSFRHRRCPASSPFHADRPSFFACLTRHADPPASPALLATCRFLRPTCRFLRQTLLRMQQG